MTPWTDPISNSEFDNQKKSYWSKMFLFYQSLHPVTNYFPAMLWRITVSRQKWMFGHLPAEFEYIFFKIIFLLRGLNIILIIIIIVLWKLFKMSVTAFSNLEVKDLYERAELQIRLPILWGQWFNQDLYYASDLSILFHDALTIQFYYTCDWLFSFCIWAYEHNNI